MTSPRPRSGHPSASPRRDMDVDVDLLEALPDRSQRDGAALDDAEHGLRAFTHRLAKLARSDQPAVSRRSAASIKRMPRPPESPTPGPSRRGTLVRRASFRRWKRSERRELRRDHQRTGDDRTALPLGDQHRRMPPEPCRLLASRLRTPASRVYADDALEHGVREQPAPVRDHVPAPVGRPSQHRASPAYRLKRGVTERLMISIRSRSGPGALEDIRGCDRTPDSAGFEQQAR